MILIRVSMAITDFPSARSRRAGMLAAHEAQGKLWHEKFLREHFKPGAAEKYKHAARSPRYKKWKRKKWESRSPMRNGQYVEGSGVTDNVLSGDMRDMLLRGKSIRAYPTRVTVTMTGPRYVTMRVFEGDAQAALKQGWAYGKSRKKKFSAARIGSQPDKKREIIATTAQERSELAAAADKALHKVLTKTGTRKKT